MRVKLEERILKRILSILSKFPQIKRVIIFGSRSTGYCKDNSDIDLAIETERELPAAFFLDIDEAAGLYKINVIILDKLKNEELKKEIEEYGIEIYKG